MKEVRTSSILSDEAISSTDSDFPIPGKSMYILLYFSPLLPILLKIGSIHPFISLISHTSP